MCVKNTITLLFISPTSAIYKYVNLVDRFQSAKHEFMVTSCFLHVLKLKRSSHDSWIYTSHNTENKMCLVTVAFSHQIADILRAKAGRPNLLHLTHVVGIPEIPPQYSVQKRSHCVFLKEEGKFFFLKLEYFN